MYHALDCLGLFVFLKVFFCEVLGGLALFCFVFLKKVTCPFNSMY